LHPQRSSCSSLSRRVGKKFESSESRCFGLALQSLHIVREASRARSDAEFVSKLGGAIQEADEFQLWIELLLDDCGIPAAQTLPLAQESSEIIAILTTMIARTNLSQK
jgi:four helix bundle protein